MPRKDRKPQQSVRMKNPVTGEVKFVIPNSDSHKLLLDYGWEYASMGEGIAWYKEEQRRRGF